MIILFDITNRQSFRRVRAQYQENKGYLRNKRPELMPQTLIVGTKTDLAYKRDVSYDEGQSLARELGASYFEVSTAINTNVNTLFE